MGSRKKKTCKRGHKKGTRSCRRKPGPKKGKKGKRKKKVYRMKSSKNPFYPDEDEQSDEELDESNPFYELDASNPFSELSARNPFSEEYTLIFKELIYINLSFQRNAPFEIIKVSVNDIINNLNDFNTVFLIDFKKKNTNLPRHVLMIDKRVWEMLTARFPSKLLENIGDKGEWSLKNLNLGNLKTLRASKDHLLRYLGYGDKPEQDWEVLNELSNIRRINRLRLSELSKKQAEREDFSRKEILYYNKNKTKRVINPWYPGYGDTHYQVLSDNYISIDDILKLDENNNIFLLQFFKHRIRQAMRLKPRDLQYHRGRPPPEPNNDLFTYYIKKLSKMLVNEYNNARYRQIRRQGPPEISEDEDIFTYKTKRMLVVDAETYNQAREKTNGEGIYPENIGDTELLKKPSEYPHLPRAGGYMMRLSKKQFLMFLVPGMFLRLYDTSKVAHRGPLPPGFF